jgi:anti-sigma regulatory factor (Ser/Thr protein kinase)
VIPQHSNHALRLRLELESVAGSVTLVRSVIRTVARAADLDPALADDLRTAISEACNNVVLHAYPTEPGPLIFSLAVDADSVEAVVRDRGCGITPGSIRNRGLGMGVAVINTLADRAVFESERGSGTEVRMTFRRPVPVPDELSRFSLGVWSLGDPRSSGALRARSS